MPSGRRGCCRARQGAPSVRCALRVHLVPLGEAPSVSKSAHEAASSERPTCIFPARACAPRKCASGRTARASWRATCMDAGWHVIGVRDGARAAAHARRDALRAKTSLLFVFARARVRCAPLPLPRLKSRWRPAGCPQEKLLHMSMPPGRPRRCMRTNPHKYGCGASRLYIGSRSACSVRVRRVGRVVALQLKARCCPCAYAGACA